MTTNDVNDITILLDTDATKPLLDFDRYINTIFNIIRSSDPNFSIGIYGEWGTGKTTMMRSIEKKIRDESDKENPVIVPIWFNAWRYERETNQATIPMMKTIAFALEDYQEFKKIASTIKRSLFIIGKEVISTVISKHVGEIDLDKIKDELEGKLEKIPDLEKKTLFYDGIQKIREAVDDIRLDKRYRIVVFIDDLDRCSPKKTLEVFESIKAFLDIPGFIFVIGLSFKTVSELITKQYDESGIKGEDYIKKIIQVPIFVQEWNESDTSILIKDLSNKLQDSYKTIIGDKTNIKLLSIALEKNPREIKRFINTFILSNEIYSKSKAETSELLLVQALKWRWRKIYNLFSFNEDFRKEVQNIAFKPTDDRIKLLQSPDNSEKIKFFSEFTKLALESDFWIFMKKAPGLFRIKNWEKYRRATAVTDEKGHESGQIYKEKLVELLIHGEVSQFNQLRVDTNHDLLDLSEVDLRKTNLANVDLANVNLSRTDLRDANLQNANLQNSVLRDTNIYKTNLTSANLQGANIYRAYLVESDLTHANLNGANLIEAILIGSNLTDATLIGANLTDANLREATLIGANLTEVHLNNANLSESNLTEANLLNANLQGSKLTKTVFTSKNLPISVEKIKNSGGIVNP